MKRFCILLCILLLPSCRPADLPAPADSLFETTAAETEILPAEPGASVYPLSEIPGEAVTLPACIEKPIPRESVLQVLCQAEQDGISAAVFVTADTEFYAAVKGEEGYSAFHFIGDSS